MDKNSENTLEQQHLNERNERILVLEKKCKQLEEINAQYCDEDEQRCKQIDATEEENRELKKENAFKAKQIQQEREENKQLKEALEEEQKKSEEMVMRNAARIASKANRMSPSGVSTSSSCSRSSSSSARLPSPMHSVANVVSLFGKHNTRDYSLPPFTARQNSNTSSSNTTFVSSSSISKNRVYSSMFSSSQRLDDEDCQGLRDQLRPFNDVEQFSSSDGHTETDSDVYDANFVEGRDSGFSEQNQQDSVGIAVSEEASYVPEVGRPEGISLAEELMLAEQQQKLKEELEKAQLEQHHQQNNVDEPELVEQHQQQNIVEEPELAMQHQQQSIVEEPELAVQHQQQNIVEEPELAMQHQQQSIVEEPELAVQHQQQSIVEEPELAVQHQQQNNNSHIPRGARPRLHSFLLVILFVLVVVVFVLIVVLPSVLRGQLVMQIPAFFASWLREHMLRGTNVVVHTEVMWHSNGLFGGGDY